MTNVYYICLTIEAKMFFDLQRVRSVCQVTSLFPSNTQVEIWPFTVVPPLQSTCFDFYSFLFTFVSRRIRSLPPAEQLTDGSDDVK